MTVQLSSFLKSEIDCPNVPLAKADLVTAVENAFIVEGLAMLIAMMFAKDLGFTKEIVEGDELSVTEFSPLGNIIDEARPLED